MNRYLFEISSAQQALEEAKSWNQQMWDRVTDATMWGHILFSGLRIIVILLLTRLFVRVIYKVIDRSLQRRENNRLSVSPRRFVTVGELLKNVTSIVSNFVMIMLILSELGVNLAPLIAGAGVLGLAIGFGAQSLVKDVITGFFVILEDQFAVGDVIQIANVKGTVEMIGLRSTRLISWTGEVHIIPNGMITNVTNFSLNNSLVLVDLPFSNTRKLDDAIDLLKAAMVQLKEDSNLLEQVPNVVGVQSLTTSEYVVRITAECQPGSKAGLEREIKAYAKNALEQDEIRRSAQPEGGAS
ncbi:mechanosensitive ion channel family protein [Paenibacillus caui]|uniref:mechanosensitive ion channel family protein n=1 Tax=Paenibacillus caui TaxID=2873927 RepID=UPI001F302C39|nr:mechanosensitive ion channel family protein [Paenibacillus caui]